MLQFLATMQVDYLLIDTVILPTLGKFLVLVKTTFKQRVGSNIRSNPKLSGLDLIRININLIILSTFEYIFLFGDTVKTIKLVSSFNLIVL